MTWETKFGSNLCKETGVLRLVLVACLSTFGPLKKWEGVFTGDGHLLESIQYWNTALAKLKQSRQRNSVCSSFSHLLFCILTFISTNNFNKPSIYIKQTSLNKTNLRHSPETFTMLTFILTGQLWWRWMTSVFCTCTFILKKQQQTT